MSHCALLKVDDERFQKGIIIKKLPRIVLDRASIPIECCVGIQWGGLSKLESAIKILKNWWRDENDS